MQRAMKVCEKFWLDRDRYVEASASVRGPSLWVDLSVKEVSEAIQKAMKEAATVRLDFSCMDLLVLMKKNIPVYYTSLSVRVRDGSGYIEVIEEEEEVESE